MLHKSFHFVSRKKIHSKTGGQILNCFPIEPGTIVLRHLVTQQTIKHSLIHSQHVLEVNASVLTFSLFSAWNDPLSILWSSLFWLKKKITRYWFSVFRLNLHMPWYGKIKYKFQINTGKLCLKRKNKLTAGKGRESDNSACLLLPSPLWKQTIERLLINDLQRQPF